MGEKIFSNLQISTFPTQTHLSHLEKQEIRRKSICKPRNCAAWDWSRGNRWGASSSVFYPYLTGPPGWDPFGEQELSPPPNFSRAISGHRRGLPATRHGAGGWNQRWLAQVICSMSQTRELNNQRETLILIQWNYLIYFYLKVTVDSTIVFHGSAAAVLEFCQI